MVWENNWLKPVWENGLIFRETFAMVREDGICRAAFLYRPDEIICVESYDGTRVYEEGKDYIVIDGYLVRTESSSIVCTEWEHFYHRTEEEAKIALANNHIPLNFGPLATTDGRYLNLSPIANAPFVTDYQIAVTYKTSEMWKGEVPQSAEEKLPKTFAKLKGREELRVVLFGDSISYGFDCSGISNLPPYQPVWNQILKKGLEDHYSASVQMINPSASGMDTDWAIAHAEELIAPHQPDLIILGYGMNDRCTGSEYAEKTKKLRQVLKDACPGAEFILIATSLPNELVHTPPFYFDAYQREHAKYLKTLEETGTAIADIQGVQKIIEERKRYIDFTGNNLNHPNDYLARIYAQVIMTLLK